MYMEDASEEKKLEMLEHGIAGCFGYGHAGHVLARKLYRSPQEKSIIAKWINFYKSYRNQVEYISLPLLRPDGQHADGVFHCNPQASPKGVLVAFNPSDSPQKVHFTVPVKYAGITQRASAGPPGGMKTSAEVDGRGNAVITMQLKPYEVTWWEIEGK